MLRPKDVEVLHYIKEEKVVTIHSLARRMGVTIQRANDRLNRLAKLGELQKVKLPKLSKRYLKPPYKEFIRKSLFFIKEEDLIQWLKEKVNGVPKREKEYFFKKLEEVGIRLE